MKKLTAIIPTYNEEDNIRAALDTVSFADEVIVIDSFSTDKTPQIIKEEYPNVIFLQRTFDDFSTQKNYAIEKASNEWIFLLDADERVTEKLSREIQNILKNKIQYSAYVIKRAFFFKGKRVYYSGFQNGKVIRLFKRDSCYYVGKVHERLVVEKDNKGRLKNKLNHYSYQSANQYKSKLNQYAKLQALELFEKNQNVNFYHLKIKPIARFLIHYFIKFGFLDGKKGWVLSSLHAYGVKKRYLELNRLHNK